MPEVNQQLIDWVKENKAKGFSDEQLSAHLTQNGYTAEVAQSAIQAANAPTPAMPSLSATPPRSTLDSAVEIAASGVGVARSVADTFRTIKFIIVFVFVAGLIGLGAFIATRSSDDSSSVADTTTPVAPAVEKQLCADGACFDSALQSCTPTDFMYEDGEDEVISFSINGLQNDLCAFDYTLVNSTFRPEGIGLSMSCLYDKQYPFDPNLSDYFNCRGPLADAF